MKQHVFFKDINWDTLARQKVCQVPDWIEYSNCWWCLVNYVSTVLGVFVCIWEIKKINSAASRIDFGKSETS